MRVLFSLTGSNETVPRVFFPSSLIQLICLSGCCSRIFASHSAFLPATFATQCRRVSSSCWTCSTPSMKSGKSSNCVHWLYATETGTLTSIDSSIVRGDEPPVKGTLGRVPVLRLLSAAARPPPPPPGAPPSPPPPPPPPKNIFFTPPFSPPLLLDARPGAIEVLR